MTIYDKISQLEAKDLFLKFLVWREKHIKERNFVLLLALVVGVFSGFAALLLKFLIESIAVMVTSHITISGGNYRYLICPVLGILISGLYVRYIVRDNISHGVTKVLYAISQKKSRLKPHNMYTSMVASSVTIGFGGSVGAEGPIVYTGAAIGSNLGSVIPESIDDYGGMRGCSRDCRNFQSSDCRDAFYY